MKLQLLIALLTTLGALAAPVAKAGVKHTDTSNLVLSVIKSVSAVDSDEAINKIKRSLTSNSARAVAANPDATIPPIAILAIVAKDDGVEKREVGPDNIIEARATTAEKDSTVIPPIGIVLIVAKDDDQKKREAKLINPYIDDVENADADAVFGE